jgi:hypothetical protein
MVGTEPVHAELNIAYYKSLSLSVPLHFRFYHSLPPAPFFLYNMYLSDIILHIHYFIYLFYLLTCHLHDNRDFVFTTVPE